ncbi:hypothetical protein TWF481_009664 [Arthrobotrys musiformis]|uniref:Uncharacterized protein n=1 Tax=Arthrobotrys musiformis TaxID=47236 RepID=A0AAV9W4F2_9PEZI
MLRRRDQVSPYLKPAAAISTRTHTIKSNIPDATTSANPSKTSQLGTLPTQYTSTLLLEYEFILFSIDTNTKIFESKSTYTSFNSISTITATYTSISRYLSVYSTSTLALTLTLTVESVPIFAPKPTSKSVSSPNSVSSSPPRPTSKTAYKSPSGKGLVTMDSTTTSSESPENKATETPGAPDGSTKTDNDNNSSPPAGCTEATPHGKIDGNKCSPSNPSRLDLRVAGVIIAVAIVLLIFTGFFLWYYIRRKNKRARGQPRPPSLEDGDFSRRSYIPQFSQFSSRINRDSAVSGHSMEISSSEPLLDDHALAKQFADLDGKITDHIINYWHSSDISSRDYQAYINSEASRKSWNGILFQGRPLLVNFEARVHMFRAILAYHVYSCVADWKILTSEEQTTIFRNGSIRRPARRRICGSLRSSEEDAMKRVETIFDILERETRLHVSNENSYHELHKESLDNIAKSVVILGIQLGSQRDDFRFNFRNKDSDGDDADNPLAVALLGEPGADSDTVEVVNEMGGTIRALISPGVIRVPSARNKDPYFVRKTLVFTA